MELLLRIVDSGPDIEHTKCGDVIVVQPDGWTWSPRELENPDWRIVKIPDLLGTEKEALLSNNLRIDSLEKKPPRRYKVDIDVIKDKHLFTGIRTEQIIVMSRNEFIKEAKLKQ